MPSIASNENSISDAPKNDEKQEVQTSCAASDKMPGDDCEDSEPNIRFFPPAYIQRYNSVVEILESEPYNGKIRKVNLTKNKQKNHRICA